MSAVSPFPTPAESVAAELERQSRALAPLAPERLVLCCSEPLPAGSSHWESRIPQALFLRIPGAAVDEPELRERIGAAVAEWGLEEVVVMAHDRCRHLGVELPEAAAMSDPAPAFLDRVRQRNAEASALLDAARDQVRRNVRTLAADPALANAQVHGCILMASSGVVLAYRQRDDAFEALL
jgi:carbonic anhydrase